MNKEQIIINAIKNKNSLKFTYKGYVRIVSPHAYGYDKDNELALFTYQYDGESSSGGLPQWRCMKVNEIEGEIEVIHDEWQTGTGHSKPQSCVKKIIIETIG